MIVKSQKYSLKNPINRGVFLDGLKKQLSCLPRQDLAEHLSFYGEMIDDRMEEGITEEEAVAEEETANTINETEEFKK